LDQSVFVFGWDCPVHHTLSAVPQGGEFFVGQRRRQIRVHFPKYAPPALPFKPVILPQSNRITGLSVWTVDQLECGNVGAFQPRL
jgi:hypothetical protein